jgi:hypothetical protein
VIHAPPRPLAIAALFFCFAAQPLRAKPSVAELQAAYHELSQSFIRATSNWRPKPPATGSLLFVVPDEYTPAGQGGEQYRDARNHYAGELFDLAQRAAEAGECSLAFQWASEVLRENPDHPDARRVLGYVERDGKWLTAYGARMFDAGKKWDGSRGWVALDGGSKSKQPADAARRAAIKNGWQVRTDHFLVTTNHSLAAGAELAGRLERLYQVWRQLFAGFYYSESEVSGLFNGERIARVPVRQFRVDYHRDRDDYIETLSRREPMVAGTLGAYFDATATAHFFAEEGVAAGGSAAEKSTGGPPVATLYHEAVHQLFQESKPAARRIGETGNFWVIEGVATYFETLTEHSDPVAGLYYTIGAATAGRLPAARERLQENYYIPLAELTKLGKYEVQRRDDVAKLYSQSSGLAAFLLDGEHSRYREPMVRYLQAVYTRKDNDESLADLTGRSYSELDAAYRRFMESLP